MSNNKSNHPNQNPLLFVTEPWTRDNTQYTHNIANIEKCHNYYNIVY
jgi:hypothetical protein